MNLRAMAINACVLMSSALVAHEAAAQADLFELEEASIKKTHDAIRSGATTCADVVKGYIERARAYNGMCTALVTEDGAPVPAATGAVRAGAPLKFPTTPKCAGSTASSQRGKMASPSFPSSA